MYLIQRALAAALMSRSWKRHSLVLQQLVLLAELAQLGAYGALGAAQRADLAAQILLHLAAGLQVCLQLLHILLQPETQRGGHGVAGDHRAGEIKIKKIK